MKICSLTISNYMQFKNLELDLTYPKGHKKEGQPLDKICIIGQSGTGKTNLLNIIKKSVFDFSKLDTDKYFPFNEFSKDITKDSYISNKFITQNNLLYYISKDKWNDEKYIKKLTQKDKNSIFST